MRSELEKIKEMAATGTHKQICTLLKKEVEKGKKVLDALLAEKVL